MAPTTKNTAVVSFTNEHASAKLIKWHVACGSRIAIGTILFSYQTSDTETQSEYKSTDAGIVIKIIKQNSQIMNNGDNVFVLKHCLHPIVMNDVCVACGRDLADVTQHSSASVVIFPSIPELRVSKKHARYIFSNADTKHLLECKKLALLVDLDQTLLHTTKDPIPDVIDDVFHYKLHGAWYHTRLRPRTKDFLRNMSELFELHICTFGDRGYARKIASLLDQDGSLFSKRIISRDELIQPLSKSENINFFFPCGDSMVCFIDDRSDVWNYAPNLLRVKPFKGKMDDDDNHLLYLEAKLRSVHQAYYELYERSKESTGIPDLKNVVPDLQRNVLKSVYVVFSGVMRPDIPVEESELGRMAMALGAVSQDRVTDSSDPNVEATTHVVSSRWDTEKVYKARRLKNVHLVNPDWLWCCAERWQKCDEKLFPLVGNYSIDEHRNKNLEGMLEDTAKMNAKGKENGVEEFIDKTGDRVRSKRKFAELGVRCVNPCKRRHMNLPVVMSVYSRHL